MAEDALQAAVKQLSRLPGVGPKTATRLVYWLLRAPEGTARDLAEALLALEEGIRECSLCCDLTPTDPCRRCASPRRDPSMICVVEHPQDVNAFERMREYRGSYHILHGAISPLDGIGPDKLRLRELVRRLEDGSVTEVVVATDPDVEGDATALYIARLLRGQGVRVTRLAHGIAVGTEIEYADALSLTRAFENRREM